MGKESEVAKAMLSFQERITIPAMGVSSNFINDVVAQDPRVVCYLSGLSASAAFVGMSPQFVINAQYKNKDIPLSDIHIIESELEMHSLLCQSIGNYKNRIIILSKSDTNIEAAYQRFMVANAAFYANFIGAKISKSMTSMTSFYIYNFDFSYRIGKVKLAMMENETTNEVKRIATKFFLAVMPEEAKIYLAHNYLASTIKYTLKPDASNLERSYIQSAYGALIRKQCVCQGFAEAFKRLMDEAGVDCDVVCGQVVGSREYHAWNIVKLKNGAGNYHIDVTWDSNQPRLIYDYFGKTDAFFEGKRIWNRQYTVHCGSSSDLLRQARRYIVLNKGMLLSNGIPLTVLDM